MNYLVINSTLNSTRYPVICGPYCTIACTEFCTRLGCGQGGRSTPYSLFD